MANPELESIDLNCPDKAYDGTLTFAGVLRRYFKEYGADGRNTGISRHWNEKTQDTYIRDYNKRLFPLMEREKPINEYTVEDFDNILERLKKRHNYSEATVSHFRHLIWVVCDAGYKHGHCDDILWGTCYSIDTDEPDEKTKVQHMVVLKKSFTIQEEMKIFKLLAKAPEIISGEELGLMLMFFTGVRNNEACGMNYGDLKPMTEHPDSYCLWVYKTTELDSNLLKASGKTRNADRILPVLDNLAALLLKRIRFLEELAAAGSLQLTGEYAGGTVLDLPVVCKGSQYLKRCSARDLTIAGKELLKAASFSGSELAVLDGILHTGPFYDESTKEKDPTTYLFRRNAGTHLYTLGFNMAQIQYYLGQDVESIYENRNSFTNEKKLYDLKKMLDEHPFNYVFSAEDKPVQPPPCLQASDHLRNVSDAAYKVAAENDDERYLFCLKAREPRAPIRLSIKSSSFVDIALKISTEPQETDRTANIRKQLRRAYKKVNITAEK